MKRRPFAVLLTAVTVGAALALSGQAAAINTYNAQPAPERTEVGALLVVYDHDGNLATPDIVRWTCSGTMISRTVFLTAAHCIHSRPEGTRFFVSLAEDVHSLLEAGTAAGLGALEIARRAAVEGTAIADPAFPGPGSDPHDIAVVTLSGAQAAELASRWSFTPATLPAAGQLSALGPRTLDARNWTVMGYGTSEAVRGPGGHTHPGGGARLKAPVDFNALNKAWVRLSMIRARGNGGACYGDSGGPNFVELNGRLLLAAITITGDGPCYATNVAYRLDTASARAFLSRFVTLP